MDSDQQQHLDVAKMPLPLSQYSKRIILKTILNRSDKGLGLIGERFVVGGWVKSSKELRKEPVKISDVPLNAGNPTDLSCAEVMQSRIPFLRSIIKVFGGHSYNIRNKLETIIAKPPPHSISILLISDGSCVPSLQIEVDSSLAPPSHILFTGTCILVEGILQQPSLQGKNIIELKAEKILHIGLVDHAKYPLSKKRIPLDSLRDYAHFRPRTTTVASVMRIRNALTHGTHTFFQNKGFLHVQVPLITTTDSEGSTKKFQVTTLLGQKAKKENPINMDDTAGVSLQSVKASIADKSRQVEELKRTDSNKEALVAALQDLRKTSELALQLEAREKSKTDHTYVKTDKFKFSDDFFSCQTYLTVSGRLHLESYACALGDVYSFGPRFCAERSESKKFLAEMSMVELEMAFSQLEDAMNCANDLLNFLCIWVLEHCSEDLAFVSKRVDNTIVDRLQLLALSSCENISYAEAINVLKKAEKKFDVNIEHGIPLSEELECYMADEIYKSPVIIYNYPKELKPFYVRVNDDGKTVAAFDLIVPKGGALIRGSQNEERFNMLSSRINELNLPKDQYQWYLDLRRHGTARSSGFSLVFDLLVLYATGLNDVRDVIPFPRSFGKAYN